MRGGHPLSSRQARNESERGLLSPKIKTNIFLLTALLLIIYGLHLTADAGDFRGTLLLQNKTFAVELATTPAQHKRGLSGRSVLNENQAMLFVYDRPNPACFWMKDMHFNLDIFWFDDNKKLIYTKRNLSPQTYPISFCPPKYASYVLETKPSTVHPKHGDTFLLQKQ